MKIIITIIGVAMMLALASCSSTQQTTQSTSSATKEEPKKDSVYVFDQVPTGEQPKQQTKPDTSIVPQTPKNLSTYYVVQIGAFSTKDRADEFANESRKKVKDEIIVSFSPEVKLFVVRLQQEYPSHSDAEKARSELWKSGGFSDAWISTVQK